MTAIPLTYEIAMALSHDAGNRAMRKGGRRKWNCDDWNASVTVFDKVMGAKLTPIAALAKAGVE